MNRQLFLAGGAGLAVAGCTSGGSIGLTTAASRNPADLMAQLGYISAKDPQTGITTFATGFGPKSNVGKNRPEQCNIYFSHGRRPLDDCQPGTGGNDFPPDPTQQTQVNFPLVGYTRYVETPPVNVDSPEPFALYATPTNGPPGPLYRVAKFSFQKCEAAIHASFADAFAIATYIAANAARFSAAVGTAARAAVSRWQGTTMGASAALSFLFYIMGALAIGDWLVLLTAVGLTGFAVYEFYQCAVAGLDVSS